MQTKIWTTRSLLAWMGKAFADKQLDDPRFSAELLVAHVLGCERMRLYMEVDRPATTNELAKLRELTARALKHEPVQYLTNEAWFYGMAFKADRRALIPRPSTETLVECAIHHLRADGAPAGKVLDLCTGSGCVAIALAKNLPARELLATDISADALAIAKENADTLGMSDRVEFAEGSLYGALSEAYDDGRFAAIVSNPPYIPDHEWGEVPANVKDHEPELALRGGEDGLDLVRPIIEGSVERLVPGGLLAIEVAMCTTDAVRTLMEHTNGLTSVRVLKDFEGLDRIVRAIV